MERLPAPALQPFSFEGHAVRVIDRRNEPWWIAKDVCDALGLGNPSESLRGLDADEKHTLSNPEGIAADGRAQSLAIINEPGLYKLILRSRKPEAKRFSRWVTHQVLPAIRRTGAYGPPADAFALGTKAFAMFAELGQTVVAIEQEMNRLRARIVLGERRRALPPPSTVHCLPSTGEPSTGQPLPMRRGPGRPSIASSRRQIHDAIDALWAANGYRPLRRQVADHLGISINTLRRCLVRVGYGTWANALRRHGEPKEVVTAVTPAVAAARIPLRQGQPPVRITAEQLAAAIAAVWREGNRQPPCWAVAYRLGVSRDSLRNYCYRTGIGNWTDALRLFAPDHH